MHQLFLSESRSPASVAAVARSARSRRNPQRPATSVGSGRSPDCPIRDPSLCTPRPISRSPVRFRAVHTPASVRCRRAVRPRATPTALNRPNARRCCPRWPRAPGDAACPRSLDRPRREGVVNLHALARGDVPWWESVRPPKEERARRARGQGVGQVGREGSWGATRRSGRNWDEGRSGGQGVRCGRGTRGGWIAKRAALRGSAAHGLAIRAAAPSGSGVAPEHGLGANGVLAWL